VRGGAGGDPVGTGARARGRVNCGAPARFAHHPPAACPGLGLHTCLAEGVPPIVGEPLAPACQSGQGPRTSGAASLGCWVADAATRVRRRAARRMAPAGSRSMAGGLTPVARHRIAYAAPRACRHECAPERKSASSAGCRTVAGDRLGSARLLLSSLRCLAHVRRCREQEQERAHLSEKQRALMKKVVPPHGRKDAAYTLRHMGTNVCACAAAVSRQPRVHACCMGARANTHTRTHWHTRARSRSLARA